MLDQFRVFSIVAQTKSFSKAAKLLHLSQPAVSSKIQTMEEALGVKLFTRTSQGVKLTEAGKIAYEYTTRFLDMEQSMNNDINHFLSSGHQLIIGSSCTSGNYALPGSISNFKQKFPQANIKLNISNSQETIGKLHKGYSPLSWDCSFKILSISYAARTFGLLFLLTAITAANMVTAHRYTWAVTFSCFPTLRPVSKPKFSFRRLNKRSE